MSLAKVTVPLELLLPLVRLLLAVRLDVLVHLFPFFVPSIKKWTKSILLRTPSTPLVACRRP